MLHESPFLLPLPLTFRVGSRFKKSELLAQGRITSDYLIQSEDLLRVTVFQEPTLSLGQTEGLRVSAKGNIPFPLLNEIPVAGKTVQQVKEDIERRLKDGYIKNPQVTVQVLQYNEQYYTVMGEVKIAGITRCLRKKGLIWSRPLPRPMGSLPMPRKTALSCGEKVKESATTTTNCSRSRTRTRKSTSRRETRSTFLIVSSDPNIFTFHFMEFQQSSQATETSVAENLNLRHYWHILLERRWLVITTFISVVILSVLYLYRAVPIYQAKTVLQINKESTSIMDVGSQVVFNSNDQEYLQTQYKNLLSRSLIESVITDLEIKQDEVFKGAENIVNEVRGCITISLIVSVVWWKSV